MGLSGPIIIWPDSSSCLCFIFFLVGGDGRGFSRRGFSPFLASWDWDTPNCIYFLVKISWFNFLFEYVFFSRKPICRCIFYIYTWNPNDLYFWSSTPQNKAFSNQNKGHLGSKYIIIIIYIYTHICPFMGEKNSRPTDLNNRLILRMIFFVTKNVP